jgi:amphi-Trp domain-containing protein
MARMHIYEDARTVSRTDLAGWLRQLANQLESGAQIYYGAGGAVAVADQIRCELEIEREDGKETSIEIEFSWTTPEVAEPVEPSGEAETTEKKDEEEVAEEAVAAETVSAA